MKFLLAAVNAKFIHSNPAVWSLKAYAGNVPGWEVPVREYTINQPMEEILSAIYEECPDSIGFSVYLWNREMIGKLLREIPKILPDVKIFLGGPEVSFHPERVLKEFPEVCGIMLGEGEATFRELLEKLTEKGSLTSVRGLYLQGGGFTGDRQLLSMDEVPFFYDDQAVAEDGGIFSHRILYYESSRGCPFRCSYCLSSVDKTIRMRNFEKVRKHLDFFLSNRVRQVKFIDRTFNANREQALKIWTYLLEHDNGITNFHFEIAADLLTEEEITLLNRFRPGAVQLEIGVQTVNETTLSAIHRPADIEKIRSAAEKLLAPGNIHVHLDLIAGLPYEDYDSFVHSFNEVFSMKPHELQLGFLKVLSGTGMEVSAEEYGLKYLSIPPYEVLSTNWISYPELKKLHDVEEMLEIHWNTCQFTKTMPLLLSLYETPYALFEDLALWYQNHHYFIQVPSRQRRYEIVLEFAREKGGEDFGEEVRKTLTLDYYLRENPKSRPAFVKELPPEGLIDYISRDPVTGNLKIM